MIVILAGTNDFLRQLELRKLVDAFVAEHGGLALEKLDGEAVDFNRIHEALASPSFLSSKKMVVLRDASANKELVEHIDELLASADETTDLIISEAKVDKRGTYYKTLKKQAGFKEFNDQDEASLAKWLPSLAAEQGGKITSADAMHLVDKIGPNQQRLASELEKLILYDPEISRRNIDAMVESSPRSTIFNMLEAAFGGNSRRALNLYAEQRQLKVEPQAMLALVAWQLHILALIKAAGRRSPGEIARDGNVNPYVVNKSMSIARRISTEELKKLIHDTLELDIRLKSEPIDADSALQNLLVTIAGR